ncbi:dead deah box helicase, partial [Nannochloropsis oceanica]
MWEPLSSPSSSASSPGGTNGSDTEHNEVGVAGPASAGGNKRMEEGLDSVTNTPTFRSVDSRSSSDRTCPRTRPCKNALHNAEEEKEKTSSTSFPTREPAEGRANRGSRKKRARSHYEGRDGEEDKEGDKEEGKAGNEEVKEATVGGGKDKGSTKGSKAAKAKTTRKARGEGGGGGGAVKTAAAPHGLPGAYGQLYEIYDAMDTVSCFLLRQGLACALPTVTAMVQQLYGLSVSLPDVGRLCSVAPQALALHSVPTLDGREGGGKVSSKLLRKPMQHSSSPSLPPFPNPHLPPTHPR